MITFKSKVSGTDNFNVGDYRKLLEPKLELSKKAVNLNPYDDALYLNPLSFAPHEIKGYAICPFKEWAGGTSTLWGEAFTNLKHNRLKHHQEATLRNTINSLAAAFMILTVQNEVEFKKGQVSPELYDMFIPLYWTFQGRVTLGNFLWTF